MYFLNSSSYLLSVKKSEFNVSLTKVSLSTEGTKVSINSFFVHFKNSLTFFSLNLIEILNRFHCIIEKTEDNINICLYCELRVFLLPMTYVEKMVHDRCIRH